jgi:hypothetical protein
MCQKQSGSSAALLLVLLLFMALVLARADEAPSPPLPPLQPSLSLPDLRPTGAWTIFDQLWQTLRRELEESEADSRKLQESLRASQTEADGLRFSLTESSRLLTISEQARLDERKLSDQMIADAQRSRNRWRTAAIAAGTAAAIGWGIALTR